MKLTDIILATRNPTKAEEIKAFFDSLPIRVLTLEDAGILGDVVEDGETLEENALKKVNFVWEKRPGWSMADDSGIFIDALQGRPGVHSARWAGDEATTEDTMRFTLKQLE